MSKKKKAGRKKAGRKKAAPCGPDIKIQEPPVDTQDVRLSARDLKFWPKKKKLPGFKLKVERRPMPCPKCRRIRLDDLSQAAVCTSSGAALVWFRCKACGHKWCLPVKVVE